jgi:hypothetical protein
MSLRGLRARSSLRRAPTVHSRHVKKAQQSQWMVARCLRAHGTHITLSHFWQGRAAWSPHSAHGWGGLAACFFPIFGGTTHARRGSHRAR